MVAQELDAFQAAVQHKQALLTALHQVSASLPKAPLDEQIAAAPAEQQPQLEELQTTLKLLTREAQESNRVNGKVVARSQKSLRELMQLLLGNQPDQIYGEHGEPRPLRGGVPVAEA